MGHWVSPGIGDVGAYQVSGIPFTHEAAGSFTIDFKYVTSAVTITCTHNNVGNKVNFGPGTTSVFVPQGSTRFEVKCKQINVTQAEGTVGVVAELTGIGDKHMTGSIDYAVHGTIS